MPWPSKTTTTLFNIAGKRSIIVVIEAILQSSGKEWKLPMALDTGASLCSIPLKAVAALGCDPIKSQTRADIIAAGSIESAPIVKIPSIKFLGFELYELEMACLDLPSQSSVSGLLGLNALINFDILLSFSKNELTIRS